MQEIVMLLGSVSWLDRISERELVPLAILIIPGILILLACGFAFINQIHRRNAEIALKRDMLDRGMSADEIERVLAAKLSDTKH
jgi:hypothetical protein